MHPVIIKATIAAFNTFWTLKCAVNKEKRTRQSHRLEFTADVEMLGLKQAGLGAAVPFLCRVILRYLGGESPERRMSEEGLCMSTEGW